MIKSAMNLTEVKRTISDYKDKQVEVTFNPGRNKIISYYGILTGVYPALFTVRPDSADFKGKTSYSYSEYMCGKVKLKKIE